MAASNTFSVTWDFVKVGGVLLPGTTLGIEHETFWVLWSTATPAQVKAPNAGSLPVGQSNELVALRNYTSAPGPLSSEAHSRQNLISLSLTLLFIGVNALATPGYNILQTQQIRACDGQRRIASLANVLVNA
jgi:hypothetical protein